MADAMICVKGVTRRFGATVALDSIELNVQRGELFGVVGPDGAGKTTLLRMMAGVLSPSGEEDGLLGAVKAYFSPPQGLITVDGRDVIADAESVKARQGYMPQQFGLYGDLSVDENLNFAADVYGVYGEERTERKRELLAFARLEDFRSRRAANLSGGMKKKLALACALIHRPDVLILDEPTTGVDPVARREFWDMLSELHTDGITTVVSTPYMDEAERCNRVAMLFEGRLLACDTPAAIRELVPGRALVLSGVDIRSAEAALKEMPDLLGVYPYGDRLHIIANHTTPDEVRERLAAHNLGGAELQNSSVRMEEAFIYLVGEAQKGAGS